MRLGHAKNWKLRSRFAIALAFHYICKWASLSMKSYLYHL